MLSSVKRFETPEETRTFNNGKLDIVNIAGRSFTRSTFEPGWRWSNDVKPVVGTESCQVHHVDYVISGTLHVIMNDGAEFNIRYGDVMDIPPGHDAYVVGDVPYIAITLIGEE